MKIEGDRNERKKRIGSWRRGARGSYEVGVCMALKELGYTFDVVTGVSIGALIGAIVVQDGVDRLVPWIFEHAPVLVVEQLVCLSNQYNAEIVHPAGF